MSIALTCRLNAKEEALKDQKEPLDVHVERTIAPIFGRFFITISIPVFMAVALSFFTPLGFYTLIIFARYVLYTSFILINSLLPAGTPPMNQAIPLWFGGVVFASWMFLILVFALRYWRRK